jgi:hypothetical protein
VPIEEHQDEVEYEMPDYSNAGYESL